MARRTRHAHSALLQPFYDTAWPFVNNMLGGTTTLLASHLLPPLMAPLAVSLGATVSTLAKNIRDSSISSSPSSSEPPIFVYQVPLTQFLSGQGSFGYTVVPTRTDEGLWQSQPDDIRKIYPYFFNSDALFTEYFSSALKIPSYQIHRLTDTAWQPTLEDLWLDTRRHTEGSLHFESFATPVYFAARTPTQPPGWFAWCPVRTPHGSAYGVLTNTQPWDINAPPWVFKSLPDLTHSVQRGMPGWRWSGIQLEPADLMQQLTLTHQATTGDQVYTRIPPTPIWQSSPPIRLDPQDYHTSPSPPTTELFEPARADWYLGTLPSGHVFAWQSDPDQPQSVHWFCITDRGRGIAPLWDSLREAHQDMTKFGFFTQMHAHFQPTHTFIRDHHLESFVAHWQSRPSPSLSPSPSPRRH